MKIIFKFYCFISLSFWIFSCRIASKLPENEKIYGGAVINILRNDSLELIKLSELNSQLLEITRPLENTNVRIPFFGKFPYKVSIYYAIDNVKKGKGILSKALKSFAEKPVFVNRKIVEKNSENLNEYLKSKGFFSSVVKGELMEKGIFASTKYNIILNKRSYLDTVEVNKGDTDFEIAFANSAKKGNLKKGDHFDLQSLKNERIRIDAELRKNGYYYFSPDLVRILADSSQKPFSIKLRIIPKSEILPKVKKQYQINDIFVNVNSNKIQEKDTNSFDFFRGLILDDPQKKYKEAIFFDAIAFRPGTLYDSRLQDITNNRLLSLGNFKFIKSNFEVVNRLDSSLIDITYFLQTQKSKSFKAEANAITRSSGLAGSQVSISWQNINTFKGAELLRISTLGGLELQVGGDKSGAYRGNYRVGLESQLVFPRFLAPFIKIDPEISKVLPKTQINLGYESFIKTGLYSLNSARASIGYAWTRGKGIEHSLKPLNLNFVKASNISTVFIDEIFADPRLLVILENQFVAGGSYEITLSPKQYHRGSFSYRGNVDFAGNLFGIYDKIRNKPEKTGRIFGEYYSQFLRIEQDFRYRNDLNKNLQWANRAIVGIGAPYGNSLQLPFVNQFYVGGNNSLRAFRARGVGPGTYERTGNLTEQFLGNNTGDIKLELNTEMRLKINDFLSTALFLDAGNVWMFKDEYIYGPGSLFSKNFYKELAIGTGLGLRLNFSFIIFRIDLGTPLRKPWLPQNEKWIINQVDPFSKEWRKGGNLIWNIAIGLPF